ncbi:MAG: DUF362 domain-containing protein [Deltaproteobacteria bacterium]|nr:DUF362 domain-containing protein [Deltaproteobacteria bacterium]
MRRRDFLKSVFVIGAPFILPDFEFLKDFKDYKYIEPVQNRKFARIVICKDPNCVSNDFSIDNNRPANLFSKALIKFTGKQNTNEAVKSLFPHFKDTLRVTIKVNTASSGMPSHPSVAFAIADSLIEAGLRPDNIIIWERSESTLIDAGYTIMDEPGKVRVIGTDSSGYGYDETRTEQVHGVHVNLTSILTRHSDYQINLGVLKHHWFTGAAICLKNHYGSIPLLDNPILNGPYDILRLHLNACDPYISELNGIIADKVPTILYVCDGLLGAYNNGPLGPPQWVQNEIMLSNDPVAIDTVGLYLIEKKRKEIGLPPLLNKALYLRTSAHLGLGTNNPKNMEIMRMSI